MYTILKKSKEDPQFVWYLFYMDVLEENIDVNGVKRFCVVEKQGMCCLNKETDDLVIDWDKTDKCFLSTPRELFYIRWYIMKHKNALVFPDIIDIATG